MEPTVEAVLQHLSLVPLQSMVVAVAVVVVTIRAALLEADKVVVGLVGQQPLMQVTDHQTRAVVVEAHPTQVLVVPVAQVLWSFVTQTHTLLLWQPQDHLQSQ